MSQDFTICSPEITKSYDEYLRHQFDYDVSRTVYDRFKDIFVKSEGIISGSSVLSSIKKFPNVDYNKYMKYNNMDIDLYINAKNIKPMFDFLVAECNTFCYKGSDNTYDKSFLKLNGINLVFEFDFIRFKIDLMQVRNSRDVRDVVRNFDLSCCMNYFDSKDIYSLNPESINQGVMTLNKSYYPKLFGGNSFTRERIGKYVSRGYKFNMSIDNQNEVKPEIINNPHCPLTSPMSEKNVTKLMRNMVFFGVFAPRAIYKYDSIFGDCKTLDIQMTDGIVMNKMVQSKEQTFSTLYYLQHMVKLIGIDKNEFDAKNAYIKAGKEKEFNTVIGIINKKLHNILKKHKINDVSIFFDSAYETVVNHAVFDELNSLIENIKTLENSKSMVENLKNRILKMFN